MRKEPAFNTYDLFNSSPFFDFSLNEHCETSNNFHTWGGWKRKEKDHDGSDDSYSWHYYDRTNLTKINGECFCFSNVSYIDLLYNGQIIKNGTECPKDYNKNCGRIDTLNQELCINENERCPLYDAGIGEPHDFINYIYDKDSNIYYSNENYNLTNKTIIGKLILNEGQPCYDSNEKLWRQFVDSETDETHLKCTNIEVSGNYNENRFTKRGEITYKRLYEQNLSKDLMNNLFKGKIGNELVYLYKREFYGIDKKCDEKFNLTKDLNNLKNVRKNDKIIQIVEGFVMLASCIVISGLEFQSHYLLERIISQKIYCIIYFIYILLVGGALAYHTIAYISMIKYNNTNYNCSDSLTNEIIENGFKYNKKVMICNIFSFFIDSIIIVANFIGFIIGLICHIVDKNNYEGRHNEYQNVDNENNSRETKEPYYANYPSEN